MADCELVSPPPPPRNQGTSHGEDPGRWALRAEGFGTGLGGGGSGDLREGAAAEASGAGFFENPAGGTH